MSPREQQPLTVELSLLGFLRQRPMYGYEIHQELAGEGGLGQVWYLKQSRLYALLSKLDGYGYVKSSLEPQEARPSRRVFQLTGAGTAAFLEWVERPVERGRQFRLEFLAKLYFARREGEAIASRLLERQRETCQRWLADQQAQAKTLRDTRPYAWLICQFRSRQIEAMLDWLDTCQQMLPALTNDNAQPT